MACFGGDPLFLHLMLAVSASPTMRAYSELLSDLQCVRDDTSTPFLQSSVGFGEEGPRNPTPQLI